MGMGERKELAKAFKQRTAKVLEEELEPDLFSDKPVEAAHAFECLRKPEDAPVRIGDAVRLIDLRDHIEVFVGVRCVGHVVEEQVAELRQLYQLQTRRSRSLTARVCDVSEISPTFLVLIGN